MPIPATLEPPPTGERPPTPQKDYTWVAFLSIAVFVALWCAANIIWYLLTRQGQPKNIDEAGYFGYALNDLFALERGGALTWIQTVLGPSIQAPLTTAVTSIMLLVTGTHFGTAIIVITAFAASTLLLTFGLGRRVGRWALPWLAVVIVATVPQFFTLSREFVFAIPAMAVTTAALYILARSRRLEALGPAVLFGVLMGLMPLSRTVTIAFLPALLIAAVLQALVGKEGRGRRVRHLVVAIFVAALVAGSWLVPNGHLVFGYLTEFGYGKSSGAYSVRGTSSLGAFLIDFTNAVHIPHLIVLASGWGLALAVAILRSRGSGPTETFRRVVWSPLFPSAMLSVEGSAALMSSPNAGLGFALPLLPGMAVVASWGICRALGGIPRPHLLPVVTTSLIFALLVSATPYVGLRSWLTPNRSIEIPGVGALALTGGANDDPAYGTTVTSIRNHRSFAPAWDAANGAIASAILDTSGRVAVAFGFRNYFVNVNTVQLKILERLHYGIAMSQIDPVKTAANVAAYRAWLTRGTAADSCMLLTATGNVNEFPPAPDTANLDRAAADVGFQSTQTLGLPDGRIVTVWRRNGNGC